MNNIVVYVRKVFKFRLFVILFIVSLFMLISFNSNELNVSAEVPPTAEIKTKTYSVNGATLEIKYYSQVYEGEQIAVDVKYLTGGNVDFFKELQFWNGSTYDKYSLDSLYISEIKTLYFDVTESVGTSEKLEFRKIVFVDGQHFDDYDWVSATFFIKVVEKTDTQEPIISGGGVYFADVSNPSTIADIKATITATDETDGDLTNSIYVVSDNYTGNENVLGDHNVVFGVKDSANNESQSTVTVRVVDCTKPVINLNGNSTLNVEYKNTYTELGATVTDNYDSGLSAVITGSVDINTLGTYTINYNVTDTSGNVATQVSRTVNVVDTTKPVVTLNGDSTVYVEYGDTYSELGATVTDNYDTGLTASINGSVDVNTLGTYTVTYGATDSNGNVATQIIRTVIVRDTTSPSLNAYDLDVYNSQITSFDDVMSNFTADDIKDGDLTASIEVLVDNYTGNEIIVGNYTIDLKVVDSEGNVALKTVTISVLDDVAPVFGTTGYIVSLETADSMTNEEIATHIGSR